MHIVMLSDEEQKGGAATAATRLAHGLVDARQDVTRLVRRPTGSAQMWKTRPLQESPLQSRLFGLAKRVLGKKVTHELRQRSTESMLDAMLDELGPDVINVHNLHRAGWTPALVRICADHAPTVWTLHDMWSFTGRCAYSWDCRKFLDGCDHACPTPYEYPALEPHRIRGAWEGRKALLESRPSLVAVTPSRWLADKAEAGLWQGHDVHHIRDGLPLDTFRPRDRAEARAALHIPADRTVLLVAAQDLEERRKGGQRLLEALRGIRREGLLLVSMGHGELPREVGGTKVWSLGHLDDEAATVNAYAAADLLVHPAPVDNAPLVVTEALACGTPVIGLPVGGVPELVKEGETGWLARGTDPAALREAIERALDDRDRWPALSHSARAFAERELGLERQTRLYIDLFESLPAPASRAEATPA